MSLDECWEHLPLIRPLGKTLGACHIVSCFSLVPVTNQLSLHPMFVSVTTRRDTMVKNLGQTDKGRHSVLGEQVAKCVSACMRLELTLQGYS